VLLNGLPTTNPYDFSNIANYYATAPVPSTSIAPTNMAVGGGDFDANAPGTNIIGTIGGDNGATGFQYGSGVQTFGLQGPGNAGLIDTSNLGVFSNDPLDSAVFNYESGVGVGDLTAYASNAPRPTSPGDNTGVESTDTPGGGNWDPSNVSDTENNRPNPDYFIPNWQQYGSAQTSGQVSQGQTAVWGSTQSYQISTSVYVQYWDSSHNIVGDPAPDDYSGFVVNTGPGAASGLSPYASYWGTPVPIPTLPMSVSAPAPASLPSIDLGNNQVSVNLNTPDLQPQPLDIGLTDVTGAVTANAGSVPYSTGVEESIDLFRGLVNNYATQNWGGVGSFAAHTTTSAIGVAEGFGVQASKALDGLGSVAYNTFMVSNPSVWATNPQANVGRLNAAYNSAKAFAKVTAPVAAALATYNPMLALPQVKSLANAATQDYQKDIAAGDASKAVGRAGFDLGTFAIPELAGARIGRAVDVAGIVPNKLTLQETDTVQNLLYGARPGEGLPGSGGVPISSRPTPLELENLTQKHGVEFAVTYKLGPGVNGGGGQYYLFSGAKGSVEVPLAADQMLIYHTHPGGTAFASQADMNLLQALKAIGSPQRSSQIVPVGKNTVVRFGPQGWGY
jgi:hypothetical protein